MAFPLSPSNSQQATLNGITYSFSTSTNAWTRVTNANFSTTGTFNVTNNTAAVSTITGAFQVVGGAGIGGSLFVGGTSTVLSTLASTATVSANALYVAGGVGIGSSLLVSGPAVFNNSVTFAGTTTFVVSTNTIFTDNIIELHYPAPGPNWTVDDGKDIGFRFHYYSAGDQNGFLGRDRVTGYLEWISQGVEDSTSTVSGTFGTFKTGAIILINTTTAISTTTGALTVVGGVGVGDSVYVGNRVGFVNTSNVSVVYQYYNSATGSLDTVFG